MALVAENLAEAVLVFLFFWGGWIYTLVAVLLLLAVIKRDAFWLALVIGASYAFLAVYSIVQLPGIINADKVGQILSIDGLWGALVVLTLLALISAAAKLFLLRRHSRQLETHS